MKKTKLTLLLITACSLGFSIPAQARISHKNLTFAGYTVAGLSAIGAGAAGIFWHKNTKKLDDKTLSQEEREAILREISNLKAAFFAASVLTVATGAFAIREHFEWNRENKKLEKKKAESEKIKAEIYETLKLRYEIFGSDKSAIERTQRTRDAQLQIIRDNKNRLEKATDFSNRCKIASYVIDKALKGEKLSDDEIVVLSIVPAYIHGLRNDILACLFSYTRSPKTK